MGLSGAVRWWEEWQLRILVLGNLSVQCYLSFFAGARKKNIRPLYRFFIWMAYLAGDSLAIYALATLFNRQKNLQPNPVNVFSHDQELEVLWAPILLVHLGGHYNISAYNIEDNELWRRHTLTALSQVTVAIYVFCKTWSSSADKRLLAAAILLFIYGASKCFDKTLTLNRASFSSIVSTFLPAPRTEITKTRDVELEEYIQEARGFMQGNQDPPELESNERLAHENQLSVPDKLFVDYAYVYYDRLTNLKSFWSLDKETTYDALCVGLSTTFDIIYTKDSSGPGGKNRKSFGWNNLCSCFICFASVLLPIAPIGLFHFSHKKAYRGSDIKVTFVLLYITYFLELSSFIGFLGSYKEWSEGVAQLSLIGYLARNRKHTWVMSIAELLQCKGLLHIYFGMKPCHSSKDITMLVREHINAGWMSHISDIESYWRFSDTRGHWALERNGGEEILWSIDQKPFDESIIIWHVATDVCFHMKDTSPASECSRMCRQISNYMMHLLFANPEMLLPGSRRNLFTIAYNELEAILKGDDLSQLDEKSLTQKIIGKVQSAKGFIKESWVLAQGLLRIVDERRMWEVIKDVWIEMLCFSAGRCRGYLHAKSLGYGGEYLTFVSLLMSHAGLETFAERQQRVQLQLPKEERVRIAKQRVEEAVASYQPTGGSSAPQGMASVINKEEGTVTPSVSHVVTEPLKEEVDAEIQIAVMP